MIIFLNKKANNGRGLQRWEKLRSVLEDKYIGREYTLVSEFEGFAGRLQSEFNRGERIFVAAGGDGTVNFLVNCLMKLKKNERQQVLMGAIGLGSSNDFHKPFCAKKLLPGKIPIRLNTKKEIQHNVVQVDFQNGTPAWQRNYFIINGSVGLLAQANFLFNSGEKIINFLKTKWIMGTIWYTGLKTLMTTRNFPAKIRVAGKNHIIDVTNLSFVINPHFSGNFCYDIDISPQTKFLGIALCEQMKLLTKLKTFFSLAQTRFSNLPGTRVWKSNRIEISSPCPIPLELDGEVCLAHHIKINLLHGALRICQ